MSYVEKDPEECTGISHKNDGKPVCVCMLDRGRGRKRSRICDDFCTMESLEDIES